MSAIPASITAPSSSLPPVVSGQSLAIVTSYGDGSYESYNKIKQTAIQYPIQYDNVKRTYASFNKQPIFELGNQDHNVWNLCLPVPTPCDFVKPTLLSLVYAIKYATTFDNGSSTVQTDVVLSHVESPQGILFDSNELGFYRKASGYGTRLIDEDLATSLITVDGIKANTGVGQWSHYIDRQRLQPNAHLTEESNLYLVFHVNEYPTSQTSRCLSVEACATWLDDVEAKAEKERLEKEEADRLAAQEKREKEAAAEKARQELQDAIREQVDKVEAKLNTEFDKKLQAVDDLENKLNERLKALENQPKSTPAADVIPEKVKKAFAKLGPCPNGLSYRDNPAAREWRCVQANGNWGSHSVSYDVLEKMNE